LLLGMSVVSSAQTVTITEYAVPTSSSGPVSITSGPDGALWFTESDGNKIGRITTAGAITEYAVPIVDNSLSGFDSITAGPDGALWFVEYFVNKIGRMTTAGVFTEYPVPTAGSEPYGITAGPDGALWFVEYYGNKIGRITTAGVITNEYPKPNGLLPNGIAAGPDGALWFTEQARIGRITTAGVITEYPVGPVDGFPEGITAGPDGALWFTEDNGKIGRITTTGVITEYAIPTAGSNPRDITAGPDGALWFTEGDGNKIGRITTTGVITEYAIPTAGSIPSGITAGPDGALWFTEGLGNKIGRVSFSNNTPTITSLNPSTAAAGGPAFALTVNGTNFSSGATVQWNGTALTTSFVSSTQLTATVPASLIASAGTAVVAVGSASAPFTVNPPNQPCTFSVSPLSAVFAASGGSSSITVTASRTDCTWTPTSTQSFITFSGNTSITGSGTIDYNVSANNTASRTGAITVGGAIFNITQGGTTCTYSLPSAGQAFTASGGNGTAAILAPPGCNWSATSGVPWVTINPPGGGSNDGSVSYTVAANLSGAARTGTITITFTNANLPYTVSQAGNANTASCTASVLSAPQVALEGRTEVLGDYLLSCSGLTGALTTDISLALNTDVTNALSGGFTDAVLSVNGTASRTGKWRVTTHSVGPELRSSRRPMARLPCGFPGCGPMPVC